MQLLLTHVCASTAAQIVHRCYLCTDTLVKLRVNASHMHAPVGGRLLSPASHAAHLLKAE